MLPEERLNDLAGREIALLESEGIRLAAEEVIKLNALGWAVETPCARKDLSRGVPVMLCDGVYMWPLTIEASDWFDRVSNSTRPTNGVAIRHPVLSGDLPMLALAYAMTHAYSCGKCLEIDGSEAADAVIEWAAKLKCTADWFRDAVQLVVSQQDAPTIPMDDDGKPLSSGEFSAYLSARAGGTPEYWERGCSIGYAVAVFTEIVKQAKADGTPLSNDPKLVATRAFGIEAARIRESRKAAENG